MRWLRRHRQWWLVMNETGESCSDQSMNEESTWGTWSNVVDGDGNGSKDERDT